MFFVRILFDEACSGAFYLELKYCTYELELLPGRYTASNCIWIFKESSNRPNILTVTTVTRYRIP